jgi:hypothetical protein
VVGGEVGGVLEVEGWLGWADVEGFFGVALLEGC